MYANADNVELNRLITKIPGQNTGFLTLTSISLSCNHSPGSAWQPSWASGLHYGWRLSLGITQFSQDIFMHLPLGTGGICFRVVHPSIHPALEEWLGIWQADVCWPPLEMINFWSRSPVCWLSSLWHHFHVVKLVIFRGAGHFRSLNTWE